MNPEDAEAAKKELIRSIPTDREAVFAYPVKWDAFDAAAAVLQPKLSAWINKKIKDLLGVEEPTMVRAKASSRQGTHCVVPEFKMLGCLYLPNIISVAAAPVLAAQ